MACAIANAAIEKCYKTLYVRLPDLIQEFEEREAMHLSKTLLYKKYARPTLLIIDEWLLQRNCVTVDYLGSIPFYNRLL